MKTPKSLRLQIGLFGRTNVGKSSLLNYWSGQAVSITSEIAGTTTDVVEKAMELLPLGPVLFLDTGGLDDASALGAARRARTQRVFDRAECFVLVVEPGTWSDYESSVVSKAKALNIPLIIAVNKIDLRQPSEAFLNALRAHTQHVLCCSALDITQREAALNVLKRALIATAPEDFLRTPALVSDLVRPGGLLVLVVPIDLQAPKGRLIMPQVQTIRDALDNDAAVLVVKEREYAYRLQQLKEPPDLVVCDSQVVLKMVADTPPGVRCTTFSTLFARFKGDLPAMAQGAAALHRLAAGDRVLIAEACSHHAIEDDIGRVKIPRWLRSYVGAPLQIDTCSGCDYPERLSEYKLIIHCGACMLGRREMLSRIARAQQAGVPVTNYGVCIALVQGVLERVLEPFPAALDAYCRARKREQGVLNGRDR